MPYAQPPKEHQFKKGQSGNPNGKPKGSVSLKTKLKMIKETSSIIDLLKKEERRILKAMKGKGLEDEGYTTLVMALDKVIRNIQLLGGKPTEIVNDYSDLTDEELIRKTEGRSGTGEEGTGEKTP